jgi:glycosyltransferase involved in cell wall biosynthesis
MLRPKSGELSVSARAGVILSHPTGNAFCRAAINALMEERLLAGFYTTIATFRHNLWGLVARLPFCQELQRRSFNESVRSITVEDPFFEIARLLAPRVGLHWLTNHEIGPLCTDSIYRRVDRIVSRRVMRSTPLAVYAYEDGALESFRCAKVVSTKCLYDLPIGYWRAARRLLKDERERWPQWAATMPGFHDSDEKLARKDEELRLADRIYVASQFTKQTLTDYPGTLAPVEVIPYGFPAVGPPRDYSDRATRKLKLLFVGGLSQRKGIADVFAVAEMLKDDVELTIVGQGAVNECVALSNALKRHHWVPSLPHAQILDLMREHDILLFPSLFEGFGLVITEAMSQGTPVITTERTAGPDLIQHEKNGWLIAAGNTSALQSQIESILNDRDSIQSVGEQARQSAMVRPWSVYGKELANSVIKGLKTKL